MLPGEGVGAWTARVKAAFQRLPPDYQEGLEQAARRINEETEGVQGPEDLPSDFLRDQ